MKKWGATHLRSSNSIDAYETGQANADLETACRVTHGLPIIHPATGQRVNIDRPMGFTVVPDHAEISGLATRRAAFV